MSAEIREKLSKIFEHGIEGDNIARIEALIESSRDTALAVMMEAAADSINRAVEQGDQHGSFRATCPYADEHIQRIRSLSTSAEQAALAHLKAEIGTAVLTDLARDGKELVVGCGEPFRVFSEAALEAIKQQVWRGFDASFLGHLEAAPVTDDGVICGCRICKLVTRHDQQVRARALREAAGTVSNVVNTPIITKDFAAQVILALLDNPSPEEGKGGDATHDRGHGIPKGKTSPTPDSRR
jgi:hypothetical protein